jgi:hypothetical protein
LILRFWLLILPFYIVNFTVSLLILRFHCWFYHFTVENGKCNSETVKSTNGRSKINLYTKSLIIRKKNSQWAIDVFIRNITIHRRRWSNTIRESQNTMIRQSGRKPSTKTTFSENLVKTWSMHVPVTMGYTESNKIKRESKMSLYQLLAECSESSKVSKLKTPERKVLISSKWSQSGL